ncbi:MAG: hypothetical protein AAFN77_02675 [Planctomycetota bacterium]
MKRLLAVVLIASLHLAFISQPILAAPITPALNSTTLIQDQDDDDPEFTEQSIYIPYEKLRAVFEEKGRGVFIPYEDFQKIWEAARKNTRKVKPATTPLGGLITDIDSVATLGKEIVSVDAKIKIELLKKGWHRIPLRLGDAAIRSATIDGSDAKIVSKDRQYQVLLKHDGDEPANLLLELQYAKSLTKTGAQSNVSFNAPQAPINRWTIRTGESDIDVQVEPMIATTEQPRDEDDDKEILAFVGTAPQVKLTWTPKAEGAAGLEALVSSSVQSQVRIDSGVIRTTANILLDVSRSEIRKINIEVPSDQKVVSVFDRNIKKWNVSEKDELQTIEVGLFEAAIGKQGLVLELEKFEEQLDKKEIQVPQIQVIESSRNSGAILVNVGDGLRVEPKTKTGLLQLDQTEVASRSKEKWNLGFRYSTLPHTLALSVEKIQPQIQVSQLIEYAVRPRRIEAMVSSVFKIEDAGVFQLQLTIPEAFSIQDIQPLTAKGLTAIPIDSFYRQQDNPETVVVTLQRKAMGSIGLVAMLEQTGDDLALDSPSEIATKLAFGLPKTKLDGVKFSDGNFVIYSPESLRLNSVDTKGLRKIGFDQLYQKTPRRISNDVRPVLAYSFAHNEASVELEARRRKPQVNVDQIVAVSVQTGAAKFDARLFYDVRYSGVKHFRLDVPKDLADDLRITTDGIIQQQFEPQPDDVADDEVALKLTGENEFFGSRQIRLLWEQEVKNLTLGESVDIAVPRIKPAEVDRSTGKIVLAKTETIDVRPTESAAGLRPIDPQTDLGNRVKIVDASMAFEFAGDWNLDLKASRFELQELKQTSISRALVRAVVLRQDELSVQCLYKIRSVRQRIAIRMPEGFDAETSFDDQPVMINHVPVTPERGGDDLIFVPLVGQQSDQPFLLELRYSLSDNARQIELPEFTEDPAAQKCYLAVYVPYEQALINTIGNWTDEEIGDNHQSLLESIGAKSSNWSRMFRRRDVSAEPLITWVSEGTSCDATNGRKFEVDGRAYIFSAIRPAAGVDGSLRLTVLSLWVINLLVFGTILCLGLALTRARLVLQISFALFVLAVLLLTGILAPLAAEHLFGPALVGTTVVVGIAWAIGNLARWRTELGSYLTRRSDQRADTELERESALAEQFESALTEQGEPEDSTEPAPDPSPPDEQDAADSDSSSHGGDA